MVKRNKYYTTNECVRPPQKGKKILSFVFIIGGNNNERSAIVQGFLYLVQINGHAIILQKDLT